MLSIVVRFTLIISFLSGHHDEILLSYKYQFKWLLILSGMKVFGQEFHVN